MALVLLLEMKLLLSGEMPSPVLCTKSCSSAQPWPGKATRRRIPAGAERCRLLAGSTSGKTLKLDEFKTSP